MKTISLKKVSAVAVASLGFGLLSVVPANADANVVADVVSINLANATTTPVVGAAVAVNVGLTTGANAGSTNIALTGALTTYPSGGFVQATPAITLGDGSTPVTTAFYTTGSVARAISGATLTLGTSKHALLAGSVAASTTTITGGIGSFSFTPTVAGSYVLTVWNDAAGGTANAIDITESRQVISITVAAAPTATGGASLMSSFSGGSTTIGAGSTSDTGIIGSRTIGTQRAVAAVVVKGSTGSAFNGATLGCEVSGPGLCLVDTSTAVAVGTARASSLALTGASVGYVHVSGDGTSGTGTVTVTVTDPVTAAKTTVGTFKVTFYSSTVATLTATQVYANVGASTTHGCAAVACQWATYSTGSLGKPAVSIVAKDSSGVVIPALTLTATSSDASILASSTIVAVTDPVNDYVGLGGYNASVTGAPGAVSGKTATITYSYTNADTTVIKSAPITFTIGGTTIVTETLGFDKASYAPGEAMVITRTAKDSAGNAVADGTASPLVTFSKSVGGTAPVAGFYVGGVSASSTTLAKSKVFAPSVAGAFTASMTGGDAAATVRTASASVTDANAGLLTQIDALNAKIVALNALIAKIMKRLGVR